MITALSTSMINEVTLHTTCQCKTYCASERSLDITITAKQKKIVVLCSTVL